MIDIFWLGQAIGTGVATMIYWRQRAAIRRLRVALYAITRECEAPYFDGEVSTEAEHRSWSLIHAICSAELRAKRW